MYVSRWLPCYNPSHLGRRHSEEDEEEKRKNLNVPSMADETELSELSKLITRSKANDIGAYSIPGILKTLQIEGSLKASTRKLAFVRDSIYALETSRAD